MSTDSPRPGVFPIIAVVATAATLSLACAQAFPGGGTGDPQGQGGSATTGAGGTTTGAGGSATGAGGSTGGLILGMGGPFMFPQSKKPGACTLTTRASATADVQAAYNSWKGTYVTTSGAPAGARRVTGYSQQGGGGGMDTVSEGIGYGMLAAVYMNDRDTFDTLWAYARAHFDANGLMHWWINNVGAIAGMGSATDADEDMAWALIMASNQWSSTTYLDAARTMIMTMRRYSIAPDGFLKAGDNLGQDTTTYPSYFSPAYFRVFAVVVNDPNWSGAILDRNYAMLAAVSGTYGLVPERTNTQHAIMGNYGYNSCRTPWRIAMDYCFFGEPRAKAYLDKIGPFFNGMGAGNIRDGYSPSGSVTQNNQNMAFIGPAGVAGMAGWPSLLDGAFGFGATANGGDGSYYPQSLRVVTMLMMSGNFVDWTKP